MVLQNFRAFHQKTQCPYCSKDLSSLPWENEFFHKIFYKKIECECGKVLHVRITDFIGSGHDSWDKTHSWKDHPAITTGCRSDKKLTTIDDKIEIVQTFKDHIRDSNLRK